LWKKWLLICDHLRLKSFLYFARQENHPVVEDIQHHTAHWQAIGPPITQKILARQI
jgi:hypothetical protein